jgi:hypothetical protein
VPAILHLRSPYSFEVKLGNIGLFFQKGVSPSSDLCEHHAPGVTGIMHLPCQAGSDGRLPGCSAASDHRDPAGSRVPVRAVNLRDNISHSLLALTRTSEASALQDGRQSEQFISFGSVEDRCPDFGRRQPPRPSRQCIAKMRVACHGAAISFSADRGSQQPTARSLACVGNGVKSTHGRLPIAAFVLSAGFGPTTEVDRFCGAIR